jgi:hypothetical protein
MEKVVTILAAASSRQRILEQQFEILSHPQVESLALPDAREGTQDFNLNY